MKHSWKNNHLIFILLFLVFTMFLLSRGINWGRVESWHPDQRSNYGVGLDPNRPLDLIDYLKPPFYTYTSFVLSEIPVTLLAKGLDFSVKERASLTLVWTAYLNTLYFCISGILLCLILAKLSSNSFLLLLTTCLFLTSAGIHTYVRYPTVDIFLLMWSMAMLYCFTLFFSLSKNKFFYSSAFVIGLATAAKYNALSLIAILVIYILITSPYNLVTKYKILLIIKKIVQVLLLTILGFLFGAPTLILDTQDFVNGFFRNFEITSSYHGGYGFQGYILFFPQLSELVGLPSLIMIMIGVVVAIFNKKNRIYVLPQLIFLFVNYLFFGSYNEVPDRFLIHLLPSLFVLGFMGIDLLSEQGNKLFFLKIIVTPILFYNVICAFLVGERFINNPRMHFQLMSSSLIPANSIVYKTAFIPSISLFNEYPVEETSIDTSTESSSENYLSGLILHQNNVDFIIIDGIGYLPNDASIERLINNRDSNYKVIYSELPTKIKWWSYPKYLYFVESNLTVIKKVTTS